MFKVQQPHGQFSSYSSEDIEKFIENNILGIIDIYTDEIDGKNYDIIQFNSEYNRQNYINAYNSSI